MLGVRSADHRENVSARLGLAVFLVLWLPLGLLAGSRAEAKDFFSSRPAYCVPIGAAVAVQKVRPATAPDDEDAGLPAPSAHLLAHAPVRIGDFLGGWVEVAYTAGQTLDACNTAAKLTAVGWVPVSTLRGIHRIARDFVPTMASGKALFDTPETNDDSDENCGVPTKALDYREREFVRLSSGRGVCDKDHSSNHCGNVEEDRFEVFFVGHQKSSALLFLRQPKSQHSSATLIEFGPELAKPRIWLGGKCIESTTFPVELRSVAELAIKGIAMRGSEKEPIAKPPDYAVPLTWRFLPSERSPVRAAIAFETPIEGEAAGEVSLPDRAIIPSGGKIAIIGGARSTDDSERLAIRFGSEGSVAWVALDFFDEWKIKWKPTAQPLIQTLLAREW